MDTSVLLDIIDPDEPTGTTEAGKPYWDVRCKVPFDFYFDGPTLEKKAKAGKGEDDGEDRATEDGPTVIEGIGSSTSVDWYGTEMSLEALQSMSTQFKAGVVLLPRHGSWLESMEWDASIGETIDGEIRAQDVAKPGKSKGYVLYVRSQLYEGDELAEKLVRRLNAGQEIGQSIGGWFTDIRIVRDEDGEVEAIIVMNVELDHIAITRSPANPDSKGIDVLRTQLTEAFSTQAVVVTDEVAQRDIQMEAKNDVASDEEPVIVAPEDLDGREVTIEPIEQRDAESLPPQDGVEVDQDPNLDRSAKTAHDTQEREILAADEVSDAMRSAKTEPEAAPAESTHPTEEHSMGAEDTNQILEMLGKLQDSVTGLGERIEAVERAAPEAAQPVLPPDPRDTEIAELKSRLDAVSVRKAIHTPAPATPDEYQKRVVEVEKEIPALTRSIERAEVIIERAKSAPVEVKSHQLETSLRDLFRNAERDGVVRNPFNTSLDHRE
jgi:hypothetical protein